MTAFRFRHEAQRAQETSWLGRVVLMRPLSARVMTAGLVAIVAGALAFLVVGETTRKERVHGIVAPSSGLVRVYAARPGIVKKRLVSEGQRVAKGESLFLLGDGLAARGWGELGPALDVQLGRRRDLLLEQREYSRRSAREHRLQLQRRRLALEIQRDQFASELRALATRVDLSAGELLRVGRLEQGGFVAASLRAARQQDLIDQELRLSALQRMKSSTEGQIEDIESEIAVSDSLAMAQAAALDSQLSSLELERLERRAMHEAVVVAPQAGVVATVLAEDGQAATPGTPLASIVPEAAKLEVHLFAPSRSIGFVQNGQEVLLRFPAFPFQKFGSHRARVELVSRNALPPAELGYSPPDRNPEAVFRVKVSLASQTIRAYGRQEALRPGMQVEADIVTDRRRLIEWIFEPLISLAGKV